MRCATVLLAALFLSPSARGESGPAKEVARLRQLAVKANAKGRIGDAAAHLCEALSLASTSTTLLHDLLVLNQEDKDEFALWAHVLAARTTDAKGQFRRPGDFSLPVFRGIEPALRIARTRATAVERLAQQAKRLKRPDEAAFARYLRALARTLMLDTPALRAKHGEVFDAAVRRCRADPSRVLSNLEKAMQRAMRAGKPDDAMRAAVLLRGAAVQARRTKESVRRLQALENAAVTLIRRIRQARAALNTPLKVEDLLKIPTEKRPAWEREHADWTNPTVVRTPNDRYRVESTCGVRTTAMAAADVEFQHDRLVKWFGKDPFLEMRGTVRLCRSPAGLEGEGQPHYWAGGFQSGNTTTLVVNASNRQGLATGLTHELTHRFDGAVYPLMPAWLVEGRAVYTASCTLWPRAETVETRAVSWGSLYQANFRGYGSRKNLEKLIEGTIDDYRDNYPVGYSIWLFLTRFREQLYGARVVPYMKSFRAKPGWKAVRRFENFFVDGKQGRPKKLDEFAKDFAKFIREGAAIDAVDWKKDWQSQARVARSEAARKQAELHKQAQGGELRSPYDRAILDRSNWQYFRNRSDDPAFGEKHAYKAGLWFESQGLKTEAAEAFVWARDVDELTSAQLLHVAALHKARGKPALAWLSRHAARARSIEDFDPGTVPAPVLSLQRLVLPLLAEWEQLEGAHREQGRKRTARALLAERVHLARRAGVAVKRAASDDAKPIGVDRPAPDCGPFVGILESGLVEEWWAPADTKKRKLFFVDPSGLLVLGRRKALDTVTGFKRDAGVREVFVRGEEWFEGTYTVRTRVKFVSAHVNAGVVIGHTRHDRGLVVRIGGGDWSYAVGRKKETAGFRTVGISLNDLRSWDGGVSRMGRNYRFRTPRTSFLLTIRVTGPFVRVLIDDDEVLSHRTTTGLPVEGRVGFHLGSGLIAFERPEVRYHRALGARATCPCEHADDVLDFTRPVKIPWESWSGRRVVGVPRDKLGTVLLCYTKAHGDAWKDDIDSSGAMIVWHGVLGVDSGARVRVLHPPGKDELVFPWGGFLAKESVQPHAGLADLAKTVERWIKDEGKRRASRNKEIEEADALSEVTHGSRARPPWVAVDPHGIVRGTGLWIESWHGGLHKNLIHRLRGY